MSPIVHIHCLNTNQTLKKPVLASIEMFHVSTIAPIATVVIYGILFGDMHPVKQMSVSETKLHNEVVIKTTPTEITSCETFASIHLLSS